tara:strand:- start:307 stop:801 length:495 start_codon:yes stop_codon:yes gene_type:complete
LIVLQPLNLIVAVGRNGVIGNSQGKFGLPWHIPEDLKRFKALTTGSPVIMGRKTHELIGRPLPGRINIVLSSTREFSGCVPAKTLSYALSFAKRHSENVPFIIGGTTVYSAALPLVTKVFLTTVDREAEGDAFFPSLPPEFQEVSRKEANTPDVSFVDFERTDK